MEPGIGSRARQVILRSGLAIQPDALHRVACLDAAAVIVPSSVHEAGSLVTSDVETVKALLSIAAQARHFQSPLPFVVAELQDVRKLPVIERAYPGAVEVVAGDVTISRLMVQNILHPGLTELLVVIAADQCASTVPGEKLLKQCAVVHIADDVGAPYALHTGITGRPEEIRIVTGYRAGSQTLGRLACRQFADQGTILFL